MFYHLNSQIGLRPKNEDEIDVICNIDNNNSEYKNINFYSIFDGHGGAHVSKYLKEKLANYFIHKTVTEFPSKNKSYNKYINKIYDYVQDKMTNFELPSKNCGSTALVIIYYLKNTDKYLKIINLGDCRAVICNENNIAIPLTKDHKPLSYDENKRILSCNGLITQDLGDDPRINGLSVSRSFGDLDAKPHVSHIPDIYDYDVNKEKFIIMACDGVWDVLSNQDAVDFVLYALEKIKVNSNYIIKNKKNIANLLGNYAIEKGSQDNISILIIFL